MRIGLNKNRVSQYNSLETADYRFYTKQCVDFPTAFLYYVATKGAYSLVVEQRSPKPSAEVRVLVGPLSENIQHLLGIFF